MLSIILIYVVPLLRKYLLPHIYKHVPFCNFSLYLKKAGLASRNIVHLNFNSTLYRSLLQSLSFRELSIHMQRLQWAESSQNFPLFEEKNCSVYVEVLKIERNVQKPRRINHASYTILICVKTRLIPRNWAVTAKWNIRNYSKLT